MAPSSTVYRTCPLCEATCGLELTIEDDRVTAIRGDDEDVFSHGFICPKGAALRPLHEDPDRIRRPLLRTPDGFREVSWEEAFAEIDRRLAPILAEHGRDSVGSYLGNPNAHNADAIIYGRVLLKALGSRNVFSASTVDQMPKHVSAGLMFGTMNSIPVPDVDRTDYLLMLGANPLASNGSLLTAPDMRGRLRRISERGGRVVVVDPRRTRTGELADEHLFIRPGTDALFLFGLLHVLFEEGLTTPGALGPVTNGLDEVRQLAAGFPPEAVAEGCGIDADTIRRIARELSYADRAAVYGRIGTCTQEFGTTASWLVDVLNVITGNLDKPGGALFARPAAGAANTRGVPGSGRGVELGRWQSRVRGIDEVYGEMPVACLAEEIDTSGEGQIRALFTFAGNPVLSTPNGGRLRAGLESLELMVSVDIYLNETTRHADVILPAPSALYRSHYDLALYNLSVRNVANYSPPVFELPHDALAEWEILLRLTGIASGQGPDADTEAIEDLVVGALIGRELQDPASPLSGRSPQELMASLEPRRGPERVLEWMLRSGPYGDRFGADPDGLTLAALEAAPHGIDLGPLEPRLPEVLRTASGKIELAPERIVADVDRLRSALARERNGGMVLIGRRQLRSNNSWMHNVPNLVRGKERCTALVHPDDAERLGLVDGQPAQVSARAGSIVVPVELTDEMMPGVVSIPHGWGHDDPEARLTVAAGHAGANSNLLADEELIDPLSGNAVLNGIPVELAPVRDEQVAAVA